MSCGDPLVSFEIEACPQFVCALPAGFATIVGQHVARRGRFIDLHQPVELHVQGITVIEWAAGNTIRLPRCTGP